MSEIILKGITWNHSRALPPLVTAAQRYEELHRDIRIDWCKRTLHEFGHASLETLAQRFDLLVIDHPMAGDAESSGAIADLLPLLSKDQLTDLSQDSAGPSFNSYLYNHKLYAIPIDAAAPAACYRPDLLDKYAVSLPATWSDLIKLASLGYVRMPGFTADIFLNWMGLCVSLGAEVPANADVLVEEQSGLKALEMLCELASHMPSFIYDLNPIAIYEGMAAGDEYCYCPFAYTYSNYARNGFAQHKLRFTGPIALDNGTPVRTVLGGTGISIASSSPHRDAALDFSLFVSGRVCQSTIYGLSGGQPARLSAWKDPLLNEITDRFFERTFPSLEAAYIRPRYRGYTALQETAGTIVANCCRNRGDVVQALDDINAQYRITRRNKSGDA